MASPNISKRAIKSVLDLRVSRKLFVDGTDPLPLPPARHLPGAHKDLSLRAKVLSHLVRPCVRVSERPPGPPVALSLF